ncbi:F-box only protein 6-like [Impatiens glandulifera]|uniref:F-box only protein 6-like n=1 Tax=Impatiens glandulifera TaxID=253017 RepID=UPI001FB10F4A|nr:F-box only protein 6-like [Impatiens glandulifera]
MESDETPTRKVSRNKLTLCSSNEMSPKIWGKFPEDLFEAVAARLPIVTVFRFLSVSRKWNTMLTSHTFRERYAKLSITQPWFYTITENNVNTAAMYDPSSNKWHRSKIHSFQEKLVIFPIASVGGIVCFTNDNHTRLFVGNPLTQTLKELPFWSNMGWSGVTVGMWMNGKSLSEGYKILYFSCNGRYIIFDSIENAWYKSGAMPASMSLPLILNMRSQAIFVDSCLYFMSSIPDGMVSYNILSGIWNHILVPNPYTFNADRFIVECGGRIMLVGSKVRDIKSCASICIWELEKTTLQWKEVDTMPSEWCMELYRKNTNMIGVGNEDLILMWFRFGKMNMLVTYDVSKKEWLQVSRSTLPRGMAHQRIGCGITFYPCITATI